MSTTLTIGEERSLHPRVKVMWWITWVGRDLVLVALVTIGVVLVTTNTEASLPRWWVLAPAGLALAVLPLRAWHVAAAYRRWRYRLGDDSLELRHGVLWRTMSSMPYHRLQQVDVGQGPLERWLGMSSVQLRSAAATTDAAIPGIASDEVDELRRLLMRRAGRDDGA